MNFTMNAPIWPATRRLAGLLMLLCGQAMAADAEKTAPDSASKARTQTIAAMSGFWEGVMEPEDEKFRKLGPGGGPALEEWTGLYFTPAGLAKAKSWNPDEDYSDTDAIGHSQNIPSIITTPFPIKFEFNGSELTMRLTECDNVRKIPVATAAQPKPAPGGKPNTAMGVSVAHWEGTTLVIRTTDVRAGYVRPNGAPQSTKAIITERYGLVGGYLVVITVVEDPMYYTMPITRVMGFRKRNDLKQLDEYGACS